MRSWANAPSQRTCAASSSLQASLRSIARRPRTDAASSAEKSAPATAAQRASFTASGDSRPMRWPIRWTTPVAAGRRAGVAALAPPAASVASIARSVSSRNSGLPPVWRVSAGARRAASRPGDVERFDQHADLVGSQRLQLVQAGAMAVEQAIAKGLSRRRELVGAEGDDPAQAEAGCRRAAASPRRRRRRRTADRRRPGPKRRRPGPVARPPPARKRRRRCRRAAARRGPARAAAARARQPPHRRSGWPSRARSSRSRRDSSVCGTRASPGRASTATAPGWAADEVVDQSRLAESRLAGDEARLPGRPVGVQPLPLELAADEPRRSKHADRQGARLRVGARQAAVGDAQAQRLGFTVGRDAERALEDVAAAVEGGERRRPVATQVVQAHQPAMRMLGGRIEIDQALGRGQRRDQRPPDSSRLDSSPTPRIRPARRCARAR